MKTKLFFLFFSFFVSASLVQAASPQFISMKTKSEFNLPQFDICLPLPPNTGFEVPKMMGDEIMFEIDKQTYYCLPLSYLEESKTGTFKFAPTEDYERSLELRILPSDKAYTQEQIVERVMNENNLFEKEIPSLKSKLGKSASFLAKEDDGYYHVYIYYYNNYFFIFTYSTMCDKDKQAEFNKLIMSVKPKGLCRERVRYENRVKHGYYDSASKQHADPDPDNLFRRLSGNIVENTLFSTPKLDLSIEIPKEFKYEIDARKVIVKDNKAIVEVNEVDLVEQSFFLGMFLSSDLSIVYNVNTDKMGAGYQERLKNMSAYAKQAKTMINGTEFNLLVYGIEELANVYAYAEVGDRQYSIMISGISIQNIEKAEEILSSFNVKASSPKNNNTKKNPISSLIKMKKMKDVDLDEVNLEYPDLENTFACDFIGVGLKLYFAGERKDYVTHINNPSKPIPGNNKITDLPEDGEALGIFPAGTEQLTSVMIRKLDREVSSVDEMMKSMKQSWAAYPDYHVLAAGVVSANGQDWGLFAYETGGRYLAMFITYINDYQVYYTVQTTNSEEEMYEYCRLIMASEPIR